VDNSVNNLSRLVCSFWISWDEFQVGDNFSHLYTFHCDDKYRLCSHSVDNKNAEIDARIENRAIMQGCFSYVFIQKNSGLLRVK
jgi:hypothetical protein